MASIQDSSQLESERPRVVTEQRILTPVLVILLVQLGVNSSTVYAVKAFPW